MTIYIMALHGLASGGPEATHQLSDALIEQGFDARLVYFHWRDLERGWPSAGFPERGCFAPEYKRYKANYATQPIDEEGNVVVLPETLAYAAPIFKRAKVLVWWLSVDNSFNALARLANMSHLRAPNIFHVSQSRYAETFVESLRFQSLGMLSDYTVNLREFCEPAEDRGWLVAFHVRPDKVLADVGAICDAVYERAPHVEFAFVGDPKHPLSRQQIASLFAQARVYVDLGNFPGKDRLPREAASMGCQALVSGQGASAAPDMDFTVVGNDPMNVASAIVASLDASPAETARPPFEWRSERDTFNTEVRDVFTQFGETPA